MRLGLTGGMGCGKSTVGSILEDLGWIRVDTDEQVRGLLATDREVRTAIVGRWGRGVLENDRISRKRLASLVFGDAAALRALEEILHPRVREQWKSIAVRTEAEGGRVVVEIPLLFEKNLGGDFDATVCVAAPEALQLARLRERGVSGADARKRIRRQLPLDEKMRMSDFVITNAGPLAFLRRQVHLLNHELRRPAA